MWIWIWKPQELGETHTNIELKTWYFQVWNVRQWIFMTLKSKRALGSRPRSLEETFLLQLAIGQDTVLSLNTGIFILFWNLLLCLRMYITFLSFSWKLCCIESRFYYIITEVMNSLDMVSKNLCFEHILPHSVCPKNLSL